MKKTAKIESRISFELKEVLKKYCEEKRVTVSGFLMLIIQDYLIDKKISDSLDRKIKIHVERIKRKQLCNQLYIVKNMYSRVMDVALSNFFTTGNVNMKSINKIIDSFVVEFNNFNEEIKKLIQTDFKLTVKRLRNKEFLLDQSKTMKMLKYVKSK